MALARCLSSEEVGAVFHCGASELSMSRVPYPVLMRASFSVWRCLLQSFSSEQILCIRRASLTYLGWKLEKWSIVRLSVGLWYSEVLR